jgi:arylsulfatase A
MAVTITTLLLIFQTTAVAVDSPNIVILFADNLGYSDIGIYGAPCAKTPNIDRLGHEGLKLNHWNSAAHLCSASRAALLTGKYPAKMGIYPRVFGPDSVYGLLPSETTMAEYLDGYATSIVGKWHLGHQPDYLPTNQGFDEWIGIPYHMSGGSIDNHVCIQDKNDTLWLPLYRGNEIVQQPVQVEALPQIYADAASSFIRRQYSSQTPFFLYLPFSHVHQLCAPKFAKEQETCQWARTGRTFVDAVEEMDWIAGQVLDTLDELGISNDTIVLFTSDNGPWVAEQECSGSKGPFEGRWMQENTNLNCTACPSDYEPQPSRENLRRCVLPGTTQEITGVHCGTDTGLGSVWEANLRMPALVRWSGVVPAATTTMEMVSTLDVIPTLLSMLGKEKPPGLDGIDVSRLWRDPTIMLKERALFFWRDGFRDGPLPSPYGRFDVAAVKLGRIKAWFWTKSAHYNNDTEVHHDPPLLFDVITDPAEAFPLDPTQYLEVIARVLVLTAQHKEAIPEAFPLALPTDPAMIPCYNPDTGCRTPSSSFAKNGASGIATAE